MMHLPIQNNVTVVICRFDGKRSRETFIKRTKLFNAMRSFFNDAGYLRGRNTCFTAYSWWCCGDLLLHHNSLDMPLYMRIANELYLKD
jgi:lysyl-tRNA synthetase class 2